ncbi:MAG: metallophosphatase family protein, partial [Actinomycetota bacterium]|nr:metallophosphatase family protein [Actinomycetota bacterium]
MRVALVSDVHANAVALETVIAALDRDAPDAVVCLGGTVQGGPDPGRCADLLRKLGWPVVLGNAVALGRKTLLACHAVPPSFHPKSCRRRRRTHLE